MTENTGAAWKAKLEDDLQEARDLAWRGWDAYQALLWGPYVVALEQLEERGVGPSLLHFQGGPSKLPVIDIPFIDWDVSRLNSVFGRTLPWPLDAKDRP